MSDIEIVNAIADKLGNRWVAEKAVEAIRAAGCDIAPTDTIDLGNVLRKVGNTPDLGGGFDAVINGLFAAAAVDR